MVWEIVKKEFLSNINTFRFSVISILCLILIVLSIYFLALDYQNRLESYHRSVQKVTEALNNTVVYSGIRPIVYRPPQLLSIFARGKENELGTEVQITIEEIPAEAKGGVPIINEFAAGMTAFDFIDVVKILLSLMAFLLTYNAISGEKETGALKQILANNLPRHHILIGKYIGAMLTLIVPLVISLILSILVLQFTFSINLTLIPIVSLGFILLLSFIFLSLITFMGLLFSGLTHHSFLALIYCLFAWLVLTFIFPQSAVHLSKWLIKTESRTKIDLERGQINEEYEKQRQEIWRSILPKKSWIKGIPTELGGYMLIGVTNPQNSVAFYQQFYPREARLKMEFANKFWQIESYRLHRLEKQRKLAEKLSCLSPSEIFSTAAYALAGTDIQSYYKFMNWTRWYRQQLIDYFNGRKLFESKQYFMEYPEIPLPEINNLAMLYSALQNEILTTENYHAQKKLQQDQQRIESLINDYLQKYPPEKLDLQDLPSCIYQATKIKQNWEQALIPIVILILINLIIFGLVDNIFLRYDVR